MGEFADEDKMVKERIDARNGCEGYLYNLKNQLDDEEKGIADKISDEDREKLEETVREALDWLDENPEADKEEYEGSRRRLRPSLTPSSRRSTPSPVEHRARRAATTRTGMRTRRTSTTSSNQPLLPFFFRERAGHHGLRASERNLCVQLYP